MRPGPGRPGAGRLTLALRLLAVALGLRLLGFARLRRLLRTPSPAPAPLTSAETEEARRLAAAIERAAGFRVFRVSCLPRAMLLERLLARRGIGAELRIGVLRDGARVRAHAWVECVGLTLDPDPAAADRFAPLS